MINPCSVNNNDSDNIEGASAYQSPINLSSLNCKCCFELSGTFQSNRPLPTVNNIISNYKYDKPTKEWNVENDVSVVNNNEKYTLMKFHFHQKSDHTIDNRGYDIELHLVFESEAENVMVIAIIARLTNSDRSSSLITKIINNEQFRIPQIRKYWSYGGSLSTPPFDDSITWNVSSHILRITEEDLLYLKNKSKRERPIQEQNGRNIIYSDVCS